MPLPYMGGGAFLFDRYLTVLAFLVKWFLAYYRRSNAVFIGGGAENRILRRNRLTWDYAVLYVQRINVGYAFLHVRELRFDIAAVRRVNV